MNPKIFIFIGFMALSLAMMGLELALPNGVVYLAPKLLLLIIAVLFDIFAFGSRYYTYMILPLVRQRTRHVVISDQTPYWLSSTGDCIVRKEGENYIATAYINIPIYVSASEMSDPDKIRFANQVSRMVGISREPVRFSSELYLMNKDEYIQKLKDMINEIEVEESKLTEKNAPEGEMEHVRGKLSMWRKMLDDVSNGISFELGSFATISAKGVKEFEAISMVQQKARELMNGIATVLGVPPSVVVGKEILKYVEPEYLIPYTTITEQISRNIQREVR
jgi:hypothetical protein